MQHAYPSANPFDQILEDTFREPEGIYLVSIDRAAVQEHRTSVITHIIDTILSRDLGPVAAGRVAIEITGYDDDIRDPIDIPEIRSFMADLDETIPLLPLFLENTHSGSLIRYAGSLVDVFYDDDDTIFDLEQLSVFLNSKSALINQACTAWGIDPMPHIARLWEGFELEPDSIPDSND